MTVKSDLIASLVQHEFDKLPAKRKPVVRDNGLREWVPLSGIVAEEKDGKLTCLSLATGMKCLPSSKLPQAQGNVLHDWHAEILAIRAFNCFVLDECRALASGSKSSSTFIRYRSNAEMGSSSDSVETHDDNDGGEMNWHSQPFAWRDDVLLHMYCSEAPCGDASMELTMAAQADATPWAVPPQENPSSPFSSTPTPTAVEPDALLPGRAYFSQLGIVRRKPSRGDAPPTLSKSCSDKLSLHQCTSLLSSVTSLLVSPEHAYISTLILPATQYSASGCRRAFSDGRSRDENERDTGFVQQQARMAALAFEPQSESRSRNRNRSWDGGYAFRPFGVETTDLEFVFSRRSTVTLTFPPPPPPPPPSSSCTPRRIKITPSNLSTAHTASGRTETTLNGVLQGRKASAADIRGASFASRRATWGLAVEVVGLLAATEPNRPITLQIREALGAGDEASTKAKAKAEEEEEEEEEENGSVEKPGAGTGLRYAHVKNCALLGPRRSAKEAARREALRGWVRNSGDEDFVL